MTGKIVYLVSSYVVIFLNPLNGGQMKLMLRKVCMIELFQKVIYFNPFNGGQIN